MKTMKRRRNVVASCEICRISFESNTNYEAHLVTKSHRRKLLATNSYESFDSIDETLTHPQGATDNSPENSDEEPVSSPPYDEHQDEDRCHEEMDIGADDSDTQEEFESDQTNFYPFPSEMFFLLYCYSHSVMHPKVCKKFKHVIFHCN